MTDADTLRRDVETARADYAAAEQRLVRVAGAVYTDAPEAAASILSIADEYGANEAVTAYLGDVRQFGELNDRANDSLMAEAADWLKEALEATLAARDRLDIATAARERSLRATTPNRAQHIHINGREFVIDPEERTLRAANDPGERYLLADPVQTSAAKAEPSLTETLAKEVHTPVAEPSKDRPRTRGR